MKIEAQKLYKTSFQNISAKGIFMKCFCTSVLAEMIISRYNKRFNKAK